MIYILYAICQAPPSTLWKIMHSQCGNNNSMLFGQYVCKTLCKSISHVAVLINFKAVAMSKFLLTGSSTLYTSL